MQQIYDDIFRTLCEKNSKLLIPLVNEVFATDYDMTTPVDLLSGEHHIQINAELTEETEIITDSCLRIQDKLYHIECQSNPDGSMILRMIEYDFFIALEHAEKTEDSYRMKFPQSAVLYLRHTRNTPDIMEMNVEFPNGRVISYGIPIIKTQKYTGDELLAKQLFFLIPYYILRYENVNDVSAIPKIQEEYGKLLKGMKAACEDGTLNEYDMSNIIEFTKQLINYVYSSKEALREGVEAVMGGKVLETYADRCLKEGHEKGMQQGMQQGADKKSKETALNLLKRGFSIEDIAEIIGEPLNKVKTMCL